MITPTPPVRAIPTYHPDTNKDKKKHKPMEDNKDISFEDTLTKTIKESHFSKYASINELVGGKGDDLDLSVIPKDEFAAGINIESEHTPDKQIQKEIMSDHETEAIDAGVGPVYYKDYLIPMENKMDKDGEKMDTKFRGAKSLNDLFKTAQDTIGDAALQGPANTNIDANATAMGDTYTDPNVNNTQIESVDQANTEEIDEGTKSKIRSICSDELGRLTTFIEKIGDEFPKTGDMKEDAKIDNLLAILNPVMHSIRKIKKILEAPMDGTNV